MYYNARYYSPYLNRWLQPDVIVPDGDKASIIPLTVSYHELPLLAQLNAENAYTLQHGHWPQLSAAEKREAKINRGPLNPQQLNRYSYVLNNPLKYTDPSGHNVRCNSNYAHCIGARVFNNSSHDVLVKGDMLLADGTLLIDQVFILPAGKSSVEIGLVDVDKIIPFKDSINGHTNSELVELDDFMDINIDDDSRTSVAVIRESAEWSPVKYESETRPTSYHPRFRRQPANLERTTTFLRNSLDALTNGSLLNNCAASSNSCSYQNNANYGNQQ